MAFFFFSRVCLALAKGDGEEDEGEVSSSGNNYQECCVVTSILIQGGSGR
jgi:hypothetical protein